MGNKSLRSGIFMIVFSVFTLSLLQVLFQSSSTKKVPWGLIYLYFIFMYCTGIKLFEFYIGYKKAKVSSWESALKITKDFMWDCLRSFYLLFLTVFKYLLSVWDACGCHSLKSVWRLAGQLGMRHKGIHEGRSTQIFGDPQCKYYTRAINPCLSWGVNMALRSCEPRSCERGDNFTSCRLPRTRYS